jgi:DNA mismatch endonuclease, patch repair protein
LGELQASEWRVCVLWECEIRTADEERLEEVIERITEWLIGHEPTLFLPNMNTQCSHV